MILRRLLETKATKHENSQYRRNNIRLRFSYDSDVLVCFTDESEIELTASVLKKRSKTHKRLKERFLIIPNRTKRANFRCNHLFRTTYSTTENS